MIPPRIAPATSPPAGCRTATGAIPPREVHRGGGVGLARELVGSLRGVHGALRLGFPQCLGLVEEPFGLGEPRPRRPADAAAASADERGRPLDLGTGGDDRCVKGRDEAGLLLRVAAHRREQVRREAVCLGGGACCRERVRRTRRRGGARRAERSFGLRERGDAVRRIERRLDRDGVACRRQVRLGGLELGLDARLGLAQGARGGVDGVEQGCRAGDALLCRHDLSSSPPATQRSKQPRTRAGSPRAPRRCLCAPRRRCPRTAAHAESAYVAPSWASSASAAGRRTSCASSWAGSAARIAGACRSRFRSSSIRAACRSSASPRPRTALDDLPEHQLPRRAVLGLRVVESLADLERRLQLGLRVRDRLPERCRLVWAELRLHEARLLVGRPDAIVGGDQQGIRIARQLAGPGGRAPPSSRQATSRVTAHIARTTIPRPSTISPANSPSPIPP